MVFVWGAASRCRSRSFTHHGGRWLDGDVQLSWFEEGWGVEGGVGGDIIVGVGLKATEYKGLRLEEVERVEGIEPSTKAWEAFVLPLNYTRITILLYSPKWAVQ